MTDCLRQTDDGDVWMHAAACDRGCAPVRCAQFELCRTWHAESDLVHGHCNACFVHGKVVVGDCDKRCWECGTATEESVRNDIGAPTVCVPCYYRQVYGRAQPTGAPPRVLQEVTGCLQPTSHPGVWTHAVACPHSSCAPVQCAQYLLCGAMCSSEQELCRVCDTRDPVEFVNRARGMCCLVCGADKVRHVIRPRKQHVDLVMCVPCYYREAFGTPKPRDVTSVRVIRDDTPMRPILTLQPLTYEQRQEQLAHNLACNAPATSRHVRASTEAAPATSLHVRASTEAVRVALGRLVFLDSMRDFVICIRRGEIVARQTRDPDVYRFVVSRDATLVTTDVLHARDSDARQNHTVLRTFERYINSRWVVGVCAGVVVSLGTNMHSSSSSSVPPSITSRAVFYHLNAACA